MKIIVGLGNPGKKYQNTRHNVGFLAISKLKTQNSKLQLKAQNFDKKFNAEIIEAEHDQEKILLVMPQTFINLSGEAVGKIIQYYKISTDDLVVVCDDLDLELETIRVRLKGSSGGHKGLQSVIEYIGDKFARIRVGIGSNRIVTSNKVTSNKEENELAKSYKLTDSSLSAEDYVLQNISKEEREIINKSVDKAAEILLEWINGEELSEQTIKLT